MYAVNNGFTENDEYYTDAIMLGTRSAALGDTLTQDSSLSSVPNDPFVQLQKLHSRSLDTEGQLV